jgi:predicted RNase H-like HicB family nuclease
MTHYVALVEHTNRDNYGVWFPDCPGCVTVGADVDEAMERAVEVLRLWAEGMIEDGDDIPSPSTYEDVMRNPDVRESLSRNAVLARIPLLIDSGRAARANISLDRNLLEAIDAAAKARGLTRSAFLASAAREQILSEV